MFACFLQNLFCLLAFPDTPSHSRDLDTQPDGEVLHGYHETEMVSDQNVVDVDFDVCPPSLTPSSPAPTSIQ